MTSLSQQIITHFLEHITINGSRLTMGSENTTSLMQCLTDSLSTLSQRAEEGEEAYLNDILKKLEANEEHELFDPLNDYLTALQQDERGWFKKTPLLETLLNAPDGKAATEKDFRNQLTDHLSRVITNLHMPHKEH